MFQSKKEPVVPVGPSGQMPGMLGVLKKVNPFNSSSQSSLSTTSSSPTEENKEVKDVELSQSSWMSGIMQKVNPFKSQSSPTSSSVTEESKEVNDVESTQSSWISGIMQKVNPFRSSSQSQSSITSNSGEDKATDTRKNPSMGEDMTQEVSICKTAVQESDSKAVLTSARKNEDLATTKEGMRSSTTHIESSSPKVLGFQWDHFKKDSAEIPTVADAAVPEEGCPQQNDEDLEGLLEWWGTVEGWNEWNESTNFDGEDAEQAVEAAADRVFMAARLFVHLFNQQEASLHQRVLELLAIADAADNFHKKTVQASVGGGVASVAGSITTITGLALAPFTFGTSLIVTAVGIGVATAGGITSASANITDTMHSRTGRAKVEQIISSYQEEIKDIKECLQFLQTGMETLEEWNFEQYVDSISKRAMNKNVKHVMKEGGRAGKALLINTESLISTVQVLGSAGGAAKAAQAITVASGVMSGLFLALDVFFLAKDSMELRKGAKTEFAAKIREVCKELQDGLLELKNIKEQLEAIMEDVEKEEDEEEEEEEEVEEEEEEEEVDGDAEKEEEKEETFQQDSKK